jgi:hypothetical protein
MILSHRQCKRFYKIFDALTAYALDQMPEFEGLLDLEAMQVDAEKHYKVMQRIWKTPEILDDFISANPSRLSFDDLRVVRDWKHALHDTFLLYEHKPQHSIFVCGGIAFGVIGLSDELSEMIPNTPMLVETTLLPFEGRIVFDVNISSYPLQYGSGMLNAFNDWHQEALDNGAILTGTLEFVKASKTLRENARNRVADAKIDNYLKEKNPLPKDGDGYPGMHKGVLADLSPRQRKRAIDKEMRKQLSAEKDYRESIESLATFEEPRCSLRPILETLTKDMAYFLAQDMGLKNISKLKKAQLIELVSLSPGLSDALELFLLACSETQMKTFESLVKRGGRYTVSAALTADELRADQKKNGVNLRWVQTKPFINLYSHNEEFTLTAPEELLAAYKDLDIKKIKRARKQRSQIVSLANTVSELCGIVAPNDLLEIYEEIYGPLDSDQSFTVLLILNAQDNLSNYEIWFDENSELYVMHFSLHDDFADALYEGNEENVGSFIAYLIKRHQQIPIKRLDFKNLGEQFALFGYQYGIPQVENLMSFFDAHVPDKQNDYFFAEKMMELIFLYKDSEPKPNVYLELFSEEGLEFEELDKMNELLMLLGDALNNMPHWANNGWTPMELFEKEKQ